MSSPNTLDLKTDERSTLQGQHPDIQRPVLARVLALELEAQGGVELVGGQLVGAFEHDAAGLPNLAFLTDRFSRDDGFGLLTIDQLAASDVLVRFAQYPHIDPLDPMGRMYVGMRLSNGRGETLMLAYRVRGGMESAMRAGRFVGRAPDGYLNRQETPPDNERHMYGKLKRWIVKDKTRWPIVRRCWHLLLYEQLHYDDICRVMYEEGHHHQDGQPYLRLDMYGHPTYLRSGLSRLFHNPFYAGWLVSTANKIEYETVRGQWEAMVTNDEFMEAQALLASRNKQRHLQTNRIYLLAGLLKLRDDDQLYNLSGYTSSLKKGGYAKEARALALYAEGKVTEEVWNAQWQQWRMQREALRAEAQRLQRDEPQTINNLRAGLELLNHLPALYAKLKPEERRQLMRGLIERIVINRQGEILEICLHPPSLT